VNGLKQPILGIAAAILVIAVSLAFISLFDFPLFGGWIQYVMNCMIPMQIVIGITWGTNQPAFAARQKQPTRGLVQAAMTVVAGLVVAPVYVALAAKNVTPPGPVLSHAIIASVIVTFWAAIMWGGWPFKAFIKSDVAAGLAMLVTVYTLNLILFRLFFDYGFMQGAPVYVAALDPHGMFNAVNVLAFYVTFVSTMFLVVSFDLWPLTKFPSVMKQPSLGIAWTALCLALSGIVVWIGLGVLQMDAMVYIVTVPIPYIFGTIVVLNIFQNSLAGGLTQPAKGFVNATLVAVIGSALAQLYRMLAPSVTGALHAGAPTYDLEIWLASSLLAVTFPFLIFFAEFFKFWPLARERR